MRFPIADRNSSGIEVRDSIVKYDMHRLASNWLGAVNALVGQISRHARQVPQCLVTGLSMGRGRSVKSSQRKNQDPAFLLISIVFLPIHPRPLFSAKARSKTGALSTKAL